MYNERMDGYLSVANLVKGLLKLVFQLNEILKLHTAQIIPSVLLKAQLKI